MQIFERKNWIEGQLRQQIDSHIQSLSYNVLAEGGRLPPWLWTTETDAPGCPDLKDLDREQLISGILFPYPWATTASTNHTLPALKGTNVSRPNSFNGTCVSNQKFYTEPIDEVVPDNFLKDSKRDSDVTGLKAVGANDGFDPLARVQRSRSRQRDLENRLSKKAKTTSFGVESTVDQYGGRMTRSRAASLKPDGIKETSVLNNSLSFGNVDGGRATRSRRASQTLDSLHALSKPAKPLKPVEYGTHKASDDQMDLWPAISANVDILEVNNIDDTMARQRCVTQTAVEGLVSDASCPVNSGLKMTCAAAPELPQTHSVVEPKKLLFDYTDACGSNDNPVTAFEKENLEYAPEVILLKMDAMQSLKEDSCCIDSMKAHVSLVRRDPQDVVLQAEEVIQRAEEAGSFSDGCARESLKLVEVDDSEHHSGHHSLSGQQSVPQDCNSENSSGGLVKPNTKEQCSVPFIDVPTSIVPSRQFMTNSLVDPKNHLLDTNKQTALDGNSIASLGKENKGSNSDSDIKLDTMQSVKEESFHRALKMTHVSPPNVQVQEEVLPATEDVRSTDEANRVSGDVHKEISELVLTVKPKYSSHFIHCDAVPSHTSVISALEVMSGTVSSEKCSMGSPVHCPTDGNCEGMLAKETNGSSIKLTDTLLSDGRMLVFSETDDICSEAEEAETTAVQLGKRSVETPTLISGAAENHDAEVECQDLRKNSTISNKIPGSCKFNDSVLVSSNKAGEYFSAWDPVVNSSIRDAEVNLLVRKMPTTAEAYNARMRAHYHLRNSSSLDKKFGSHKANASSIPCRDTISMQMETMKDDILAVAKDAAEKNVIQHLETPNNIGAQIAAPESRYFLRSLTSQQKKTWFLWINWNK